MDREYSGEAYKTRCTYDGAIFTGKSATIYCNVMKELSHLMLVKEKTKIQQHDAREQAFELFTLDEGRENI